MENSEFAKLIIRKLNENGWAGDIRAMQVLCLAEEVGEFVGAARRYLGLARRSGPLSDVAEELSDVVIVAHVCAELFGIDLGVAIREKQAKITSRPWRDSGAACPQTGEGCDCSQVRCSKPDAFDNAPSNEVLASWNLTRAQWEESGGRPW